MQSASSWNDIFVVVPLGVLLLAAFLFSIQPASSQPGPALPATPSIVNGIGDQSDPAIIDPVQVATQTVSIEARDPHAAEENQEPGVFTVYRSPADPDSLRRTLTVNFDVGGTAATDGTDYAPLSGSVTFQSGFPTATIPIMPVDDGMAEPDETVIVTLTGGPGYKVGSPDSATVTIVDNDRPTPTPTLTPTPAPEIRISKDPIGRQWLFLWHQPSERLFDGPNTVGRPIIFFHSDEHQGRVYRGANATGEILFHVDFDTGQVRAGPNATGPLVYTLVPDPFSPWPEVRVYKGSEVGPIIYTISNDDMYEGPNVTGRRVYHGSHPLRGPIQFLLPLLADGRIP